MRKPAKGRSSTKKQSPSITPSTQSHPTSTLPAPSTPEAWRNHWNAQGQTWRTEPEIDAKRQSELNQRRAVIPDIEKGIYPFKGVKLNRADIEWLLSTHANGQGPVDWSDESQKGRIGLDVRGADLSLIDLSRLPLARLYGGLTMDEWKNATEDERHSAVVIMEMSNLSEAHLEAAILNGAHLKGSYLSGAYLQEGAFIRAYLENTTLGKTCMRKAVLIGADMEGINLDEVDMEGVDINFANLSKASLKKTNLRKASISCTNLEDANLSGAKMESAVLNGVRAKRAKFIEARLDGAILGNADLTEANLNFAHLTEALLLAARLERATLNGTYLTGAHLNNAHLEGSDLKEARLVEVDLSAAHLEDADLKGAILEKANLKTIILANRNSIGPQIADIQWGTVNLTVVSWAQVKMLGDEYEAQQKERDGKLKHKDMRLSEYETAVRANRQLAVMLETQGLEDATRFAHRACSLQRQLYWRRRNFWKWSGSAMLALLAGYGYSMWRILVAYATIVLLCAGAYYILGMYYEPHLSFLEAILTSITAFHGRVFSEPFLQSGDPQLWVTAFEAVAGLVIEGVFIAMLTQKFFGK